MSKTVNIMDDDSTVDKLVGSTKEFIETASDALELIGGKGLPRTLTAIGVGVSLLNLGRNAYSWYKDVKSPNDYFIKITDDGPLFEVAEEWLMHVLPEDEQRSIVSKSRYATNSSGSEAFISISPKIDGSVKQDVVVGGHHVVMSTESFDTGNKKYTNSRENDASGRVIQFKCKSSEARKAVMDELNTRASATLSRVPKLLRSRSWGEFVPSGKLGTRPKESVILKEGQMDYLLKFIENFKGNEKEYDRLGLPYHTGILLSGLPGSGKSSTAMAIATELGMDVYYVSLSALSDDDSLFSCMEGVGPHSIIIFEDIDVVDASSDRSDEGTGVTMDGLLNSLDGQMSPHGAVFIMTTNHPDQLDEAIVRSGRVDLEMKLDALDDYQLRSICEYYMGYVPENLPHVSPDYGVTTADIVSIFKNHINRYSEAEEDIFNLVSASRTSPALRAVV